MRRIHLSTVLVLGLAALQVGFAWTIREINPRRDYLAPPPTPAFEDALSFGDSQFLFRMFALEVQDAGDTGGRIVPVKNYDFSRVIGWLEALQRLDTRSEFAVGMANGYFGLSQNVQDVGPIVRFMMRNVDIDPQRRWHWLYGAIYLARHRLQDDNLALAAARQLAAYPFDDVEPWATLMPAFILEDQGKYRDAIAVVRATIDRFGTRLDAEDAKWTKSYLDFLLQVDSGALAPRKRTWQENR